MFDSVISKIRKVKFSKDFSVLAGFAFFIYCILRAYYIGISHDEAYTFQHFARNEFWEIISQQHTNLNNHMLNSLLVKISYMLFGPHVFFIRLPSIVLFGVFLIFSFKLLESSLPSTLLLPSFVIMISNPYLLDFFSMARGYSGSFAFMMASIYYTFLYVSGKNNTIRNLWLIGITASLTVLFHFSMLNFLVPFMSTLFLWLFIKALFSKEDNKNVFKRFFLIAWRPLIVFCLVMCYVIPLVLHFKRGGDFNFSLGNDQKLSDSFASLGVMTSYLKYPFIPYKTWVNVSVLFVSVLMLLSGGMVLYNFISKGKLKLNPITIFLWLLLINVFLILCLQHILIKSPFPLERFILFSFVLLLLLLIYLVDALYSLNRNFRLVIIFLSFAFLVQFGYSANLTYCLNWQLDSKTEDVIKTLEVIHSKNPNTEMNVGCDWNLEPSLNYYRFYKKLYWLRNFHREGLNTHQQFYYIPSGDKNLLPTQNVKIVYYNPLNKMALYENMEVNNEFPILEKEMDASLLKSTINGKPCIISNGWQKVCLALKDLPLNTEFIAEACITAHFDPTQLGYKPVTLVLDEEGNSSNGMWKPFDFNVSVINGKEYWQNIYLTCTIPAKSTDSGDICAVFENYAARNMTISGLKLKVWRK